MSRRLTVGSLFSGIGGIDLGLERAGMRTVWFCENDPYCQRVLAKHWPEVPIYDDITTLDLSSTERPDIIAGGFPCQDISNAGLRAGITGERSGLWREMVRIIRVVRPRYVLVENVPGLLVRGMDVVLGDLAALGFDAEWDCIPAAAIGAPHIRDRVFILAYPDDSTGATKRGKRADSAQTGGSWRHNGDRSQINAEWQESIQGTGEDHCQVAYPAGAGWASERTILAGASQGSGAFSQFARSDWWEPEPAVGRVAYGVPSRMDRLRTLGNAVVPQVAEYIGRQIMAFESQELEDA